MLFLLMTISAFVAITQAKPYAIDQFNVVTVPPNCPTGQSWLNGQCRDVWRIRMENIPSESFDSPVNTLIEDNRNVVTVPPNCPPGQEWYNGACRDVWLRVMEEQDSKNSVIVPPNCPPGKVYVNGACRDIWRQLMQEPNQTKSAMNQESGIYYYDTITKENKNIISVPNQCPVGYKPDANGICRKIFDMKKFLLQLTGTELS